MNTVSEQISELTPEEVKAEKRRKLDEFMRGDVAGKAEAQNLKKKEEHEIDVSKAAEERKEKERVVPPVPLTAWQRETQDLELEGLVGLGRNPEDIVIGEKRKDEEVGK